LSIIIVTFNSKDCIENCISSIKKNYKKNYEIIIIDNNSSDNTIDLINRHVNSKIKLIKNKRNNGFTKAVNQGFKICKGEYILNLNPDVEILDKSIEILIEKMNTNHSIGIISPQLVFPNGKIQYSCRRFPTHWNIFTELFFLNEFWPKSKLFNGWKMGDFNHKIEMSVDQTAGAAFIIKRELFDKLSGFDESFPMFFSDVDLCKRVKNLNLDIFYTIKSKMIHIGGNSIYKFKISSIITSSVSLIRFFFKHYNSKFHFILNIFFSCFIIPIIVVRIIKSLILPRKLYQRETL
tara:strand:- start:21 stop:899 length:879 start_codon:yes stop_codon:yes gene_type:complete